MGKELSRTGGFSTVVANTVPANLVSTSKSSEHADFDTDWYMADDSIGSKIGLVAASIAGETGLIALTPHLDWEPFAPGIFMVLGFIGFGASILVNGIPVLGSLMENNWKLAKTRNSRFQAVPDHKLKEAHEVDTGRNSRYDSYEYDPYGYKRLSRGSSYWKVVKKPSLRSMLDIRRFFRKTVISQYINRDLENDEYTLVTYKGTFYRVIEEKETLLGDRAVFRRALRQNQKMNKTSRTNKEIA